MKHLKNHHIRTVAALLGADFVVFGLINPRNAAALWLITGYVLLGLTLFGLAGLAAQVLKGYGAATYKTGKRFLRYGTGVAVVLIGLQSIGQLTFRDVLALMLFVCIAYWYLGYGKKATG